MSGDEIFRWGRRSESDGKQLTTATAATAATVAVTGAGDGSITTIISSRALCC